MASPLPEPFTLVDILGDGEILTCKAELGGSEVLVHVLPADPAARDRVMARIARLPRNPDFLDRIEHQGHSLVVTRLRPEFERFEAWLDEVSPEGGGVSPQAPPPAGEATRLVLSIREHVGAKQQGQMEPSGVEEPDEPPEAPVEDGEPDEPPEAPVADGESAPEAEGRAPRRRAAGREERGGSETVLMDMSEGFTLPGQAPPEAEPSAEGVPAGTAGAETRPEAPEEDDEPDEPAEQTLNSPMASGLIGVPAAWSAEDEDEPRTVEMEAAPGPAEPEVEDGDEATEAETPTIEPRPAPSPPAGESSRATTAKPAPSPFARESGAEASGQAGPSSRPADDPVTDPGSTRQVTPPAAASPPPRARPAAAGPAAAGRPEGEDSAAPRRTRLFLSAMPPDGASQAKSPPPAAEQRGTGRRGVAAEEGEREERTAPGRPAAPAEPARTSASRAPRPTPPAPGGMGALQVGLLAAAAVVAVVALAVWYF